MISLVTATLGRVNELKKMLDSLSIQTYHDFELILVDQNEHYLVHEMLQEYLGVMNVKYVRSAIRGLSYNRNIGLKYCEGSIVGFPDDDCFYDRNVLNKVVSLLNESDYKFAVVEARDSLANLKFINNPHRDLSRLSVFKYCISYNIFVYYNADASFDEKLGVGTFFSSGEETDYLLNLLSKYDRGRFVTDTCVYHPWNNASVNYDRAFSYALGFGALFKKEIIYRKNYGCILLFLYYLLRTIGGLFLSDKKRFYYYTLKGRLTGFLTFSR